MPYADGYILANLKYARQIDVMVRLPEDRRMYEQLMGILRVIPEAWQEHPDVRYLSGHKQTRQMRVAKMDELNDWEGFVEAAQALDVEKPTLSGFAIQSDQLGKDGKPKNGHWSLLPLSIPPGRVTHSGAIAGQLKIAVFVNSRKAGIWKRPCGPSETPSSLPLD